MGEADSCHSYQLMLKSGVPADNIILMMQEGHRKVRRLGTRHRFPTSWVFLRTLLLELKAPMSSDGADAMHAEAGATGGGSRSRMEAQDHGRHAVFGLYRSQPFSAYIFKNSSGISIFE